MTLETELQEIFAPHTAAIQTLAQTLRAKVQAIQPDLEQSASVKLSILYFKHNGVVCALSVHKAHVNLHFYKGVQLTDPAGLLQGGGKALRHLKFTKLEDIDEAILARFVHEAYHLNQ
jgi:hypothetical protein